MKKEKNDMANKICEQKLILGNSSSLNKKKKEKEKIAHWGEEYWNLVNGWISFREIY